MPSANAVRFVACFEALKGALVLIAATGILSLAHQDVYSLAAALIAHAHLNPASRYPQIFLDAAASAGNAHLLLLALGAAAYSMLRFAEAFGLYSERAWAEVLAAASAAVYIPFECFGLLREPTWHGAVLLLLNLAVVALMLQALHRRRAKSGGPPTAGTAV